MIYANELKNLKMYKRRCRLPIVMDNKRKGSVIVLITPDIEASIGVMNHSLFENKYHKAYYIERDIMYMVNKDQLINESGDVLEDCDMGLDPIQDDYAILENGFSINNEGSNMILLNSDFAINEGSSRQMKKIFYKERMRRPDEVFRIYDKVKKECPQITRAYIKATRYKGFNTYVDFYYYNQLFFKNNMFKLKRGLNLYFDMLNMFINDARLKEGYDMKTIMIPVNDWKRVAQDKRLHLFKEDLNPVSLIYMLARRDLPKLQKYWGDIDFIFTGNQGYFKVNFSEMKRNGHLRMLKHIKRLQDDVYVVPDNEPDEEEEKGVSGDSESNMTIKDNIISRIERGRRIKIDNLTGSTNELEKELLDKIDQATVSSSDTIEALDKLNDDEEMKRLIIDLSKQEDEASVISKPRQKRMKELKDNFNNLYLGDKTVDDLLNTEEEEIVIPEVNLDIDSINEEWSKLKFTNFEDTYDLESDLIKMINSFSDDNKKNPLAIRKIDVEDTSTSENYVKTYIFHIEDTDGKRYQLKLDMPEIVDGKFLHLKGNKKTITRQLMLLPVVKTDRDTVQVVTDYNKLFLTRFGTRGFVVSDRIGKTVEKLNMTSKDLKVIYGDNSTGNGNYILPIDYVELGETYTSIATKRHILMFNQKEIRKKYKDIKIPKDHFPIAYDMVTKELLFCRYDEDCAMVIKGLLLGDNKEYIDVYNKTNPAKRYAYTRVKILNNQVPLIVVLAYNEGLTKVMKKANVKYQVHAKRPKYDKDKEDIIRFKDGYISYKINYDSSLLMNGIKTCNTEDYEIGHINNKSMYLEFLELFGGRILADGMDNFYELMIDPISMEVLKRFDMPTDYVSLLIYANSMLADNSFTRHVDMTKVRYRSNEIIAACAYKVLSTAYGRYKTELKKGRKNVKMSIKQTAVIDEILTLNTASDASDLTHVLEAETLHAVSSKGPSGLNSERAYSLDKRAYDPSMLNLIAMSTPQGPGVGVNRQSTIDMNIEGKRGYMNIVKDPDELSLTKTMGISEAMTPFSSTRDDPPRTSMNLSQTKHTMRIKHSDPLLITNGVDEALPYMLSNTFSHKTKDAGEVVEKTDELMIIQYKNGKKEMVDLRNNMKKNSSSGFYIPLKLDTDLKVGSKFKKNSIIAYDKQSYSPEVGHTSNIAAKTGVFAKVAIMNTDDGFEDSAIISDRLSEKMASDIVIKRGVTLGKNANIYNMVKKGQDIQEGDPLLLFQNSYDEEDVNVLLRNLVDDESLITDLGRIPINSKNTGVIEDIKMYRTVEKDELSPTLKKEVNKMEANIRKIKKVMKEYDVEHANRFGEPDYKLDPTGKLKDVNAGVLIEFYIKYSDKMGIGDKLTYFVALKGIVKTIFPKGDEPYTNFRKDEKIDSLLAIGSVNARMICSVKINLLLNKILIELGRSVKDILGIKFDEDGW